MSLPAIMQRTVIDRTKEVQSEIPYILEHLSLFPCFACREIISPTASNCRFCGAPVDYDAARFAAEQQTRLQQAKNRAKALRLLSGAFLVFLLFVLIAWRGPRTSLALLAVLPVLLAVRWIRPGNSSGGNRDFTKMRGHTLLALAGCCVAGSILN
ncbi:MAG: hypothetical protein JWM21_4874 [Acidobacteria bacterium]|nr:hypothetical protein [Acidobacteriota bacterium]